MLPCAVRATSQRVDRVQSPIIAQVADWICAHPGTLSLGQGVAGYAPPAEAAREVERLAHEPHLHRYQSVDGLPELRETLTTRLRERHGPEITVDRALMVTAGANAAFLQVILAICDPGDEVLLPLPYYFNQEMALTLAHVHAVPIPCDARHHPDFEALERSLTPHTRAIVTVSPNNPTGAVYPAPLLRAINDLCARRGVFHVSDETYAPFVYAPHRHVSPGASPGAADHTISLFSFSKAYGIASWRIGCALFPKSLHVALRKVQDTVLICPPVVSQLAALGCLRAGEAWLNARVTELEHVRNAVLRGLSPLADLAEVSPLDGAFYAFLRLRHGGCPIELTRRLIAEHRVAVIPGTAFGLGGAGHLRIAYGTLAPDTAVEALGRLVTGLRALAG